MDQGWTRDGRRCCFLVFWYFYFIRCIFIVDTCVSVPYIQIIETQTEGNKQMIDVILAISGSGLIFTAAAALYLITTER
jgi:adenine/guanine phosphoribosyltransferase-like PRPP-binding protein